MEVLLEKMATLTMADQKSNDKMLKISFPDGSVREFASGITGYEIAKSISPSLAKEALGVKIDGKLCDVSLALEHDAKLVIVTKKDADALELIRHDAAHVMAEAVQELYPGTQVTIGPSIEHGFYYDFARDQPFTTDDLEKIEQKMRDIIARNEPFVREVWDRNQAIAHFKKIGENYKAEIIQDLPESETITIYRQGKWMDLCRGPHLPSTGKVGTAFKLLKVAGAYWRGDHRNQMLQRIYGTAWRTPQELADHLTMLEESEKRDHRRLGREMGLFHQQDEAVGSVFWHPKGWAIWRCLEHYIRRRLDQSGYREVKTPQLLDKELWVQSGHWEKFGEKNMFVFGDEESKRHMILKPMNCPAHIQIFKQGIKSYRDLPLRLAEFGCCHRNESSGSLHGIMRVRAFTQDDAHIFCTEAQIEQETVAFCNLLLSVYKDLGFTNVLIKFSDRPETRAGTDQTWDHAENSLRSAIEKLGIEFQMNPGEGAFYGPKLEFVLKDAIGRDWQCGTFQLDFVLPERLDASYVAEDGSKKRPVMLHRAILGTFERFIGVLIEHYAGKFPLWLCPVQVVVTTITSDADDYAQQVHDKLLAAGIRVELDVRNEKINYKIREHSVQKTPIIAVVGKNEATNKTLALRRLGQNDQEIISLDEALIKLVAEARSPLGDLLPLKIS